MEWVPLSGYEEGINQDDKPRKLTEEEIGYITAHLPTVPSADSFNVQATSDWVLQILQYIKRSLGNLNISQMKSEFEDILSPEPFQTEQEINNFRSNVREKMVKVLKKYTIDDSVIDEKKKKMILP